MTRKRQSHPINALDVAAYILSNHSRNTPILAWKMHKLVYLCQLQQLKNEGVAMFNEKIMATHKGIKIKELCVLHHNQWFISDYSIGNLNHLSFKQIDTIGEVMKEFGDKTIEELDKLIQLDPHWKKARQMAGNNNEFAIEINLNDGA